MGARSVVGVTVDAVIVCAAVIDALFSPRFVSARYD
jgi:hypothetical protein